MTVVVYPALVTPLAGGGLSARFADFPAVAVEAASAVDLIRVARERLGAELQRLESDGDIWPEPSAMQHVGGPAGGSILLVDVSVEDTPVRLTISLGERLLKRIDEDAAARSMTRSGYLALGARRMLGETATAFGDAGGETGRKIQDEIEDIGRRLNEALGPTSTFGRTLADLDNLALDGFRRLGDEVRAAMKPRSRRSDADGAAPARETDPGPGGG